MGIPASSNSDATILKLTPSKEKIAYDLKMQVMAKFLPHKLTISPGYQPKTDFEKHCWNLYQTAVRK